MIDELTGVPLELAAESRGHRVPRLHAGTDPVQDRDLHSQVTGSRGHVSACSGVTTRVERGRGSERAESQMAFGAETERCQQKAFLACVWHAARVLQV